MQKRISNSTLETVKSRLRRASLAVTEGTMIGSEETLIGRLRVSRSTLRQAARLLEQEGFLGVRRGIGGGYFSARPNERTIQTIMSAYLDTLDLKYEDVTAVASVLWVEVLRRAASLNSDAARKVAEAQRRKVVEINSDATFHQVAEVEQAIQEAIFKLAKSSYIQLIFHINHAFSIGRFPLAATRDSTAQHREFVQAWREAKLVELRAIGERDVELAMIAARHTRTLWHGRFWAKKLR